MKKIIPAFLVIFLLIANCCICVSAKNIHSLSTMEKVDILKSLNMINEDYDSLTMENEKPLTRAEFAFLAANVLLPDRKSNKIYYHDIPGDDWASNSISVLVEAGYLTVDSERMFRPEEDIEYDDAIIIALRALGYGNNFTLDNIRKIAGQIRISEGMLQGDGVTFTSAVNLLFNTLFTNVFEVSSISGKGITFSESDETYIAKYYDIYMETGIVDSYEGMSAVPNVAYSGTYISGVRFETGKIDLYDCIGNEIIYVYKFDDRNDTRTLLWARKDDNSEELTLFYEENEVAFDKDTYKLTYYNEKGNRKSINLKQQINVLYNGAYLTSGIEDVLSSRFYSIKLIQKNGEYETAIVESYENYVVGSFDIENECIYDRITGKKLYTGYAHDLQILNEKGQNMSLEDIKIDNIITVYESKDKQKLKIIVSDSSVQGVVSSIDHDNFGNMIITMGDYKYKVENNKLTDSITVGCNITGYTDIYGTIVNLKKELNSQAFAYLITLYYSEDDEDLTVKIFNQNGEIKKPKVSSKLLINDTIRCKSIQDAYKKLSNYGYGLIMYNLSLEGEINKIYYDDGSGTLLKSRFSKQSVYYRNNSRMGDKMYIGTNTLIFGIPKLVHDAEDDDFVIASKSMLYSDKSYTVESYATSDRVGYEEVVIVYDNDWNDKNGNGLGILVTKIKSVINQDGDAVDCIVGYQGNQKVEKNCKYGFSVGSIGVESGDYIAISENSNSEIINATIKYDYSTGKRPKDTNMHQINAFSSGYVNDVNGNIVTVGVNSGSDFDEAFDLSAGAILIYDERNDDAILGTAMDLITYRNAGTNCDLIFSQMRYSKPLVYVIYRQ